MVSLFLEIFKNDDVILREELSPGNLFSDALFRDIIFIYKTVEQLTT
ncbi:hypothetical protein T4B_10419 [Trichinella pseudospiralis]|uniref:Uncharacterized protein n=1 Tax=Trichinella pseudospiralis TaxID=6337 RepID=A0A0V1GE17_TRIPS|nr:hypothetical protein T4B_10419 [Trichinella pseudospiralis]